MRSKTWNYGRPSNQPTYRPTDGRLIGKFHFTSRIYLENTKRHQHLHVRHLFMSPPSPLITITHSIVFAKRDSYINKNCRKRVSFEMLGNWKCWWINFWWNEINAKWVGDENSVYCLQNRKLGSFISSPIYFLFPSISKKGWTEEVREETCHKDESNVKKNPAILSTSSDDMTSLVFYQPKKAEKTICYL